MDDDINNKAAAAAPGTGKTQKSRFKKFLGDVYSSRRQQDDESSLEVERKIVLLNIIFTLVVVAGTPYTILTLLRGKLFIGIFDTATVLLIVFTFFYLRHTGDHVGASLTTTGLLSALLLFLVVNGGIGNTGPLWAFTGPYVIMFLLGPKKGAIWLSVFLGLICLALFLPGTPLLLTTYPADFSSRFVTIFFLICIVAYFSEWMRTKTLDKIKSKTSQLEKALQDLKESEEKRELLQDELLSAKKLEAVGTLAGGMAHEFNNQISIVMGQTELLQRECKTERSAARKLASITRSAERIAALTDQLLSFSMKQILQTKEVNLNDLVMRSMHSIRQDLGEGIPLVTHLEPELETSSVDPGLILQVITEIVSNASDAMPEGGTLTIRTENITFEPVPRLPGSTDQTEDGRGGRYVCMSIQDSGCGMDTDTSAKMFEPFFTTKGTGKGVGLGLSFVYGTVKQHGGWIDVYTNLQQGTTLKVYFPAGSA